MKITMNTAFLKAPKKPKLTKQEHQVLTFLGNRHSASTRELKALGIKSPSAVISKLKKHKGYNIRAFYRKGTMFLGHRMRGHYRYMLVSKALKGGVA
ncbi:hypothetical protein J3998_12685 [Thiomicrorhabdus sp. 6S2-11]|uniref:Uncharacterized protein n=1 Tax=Thiomicrorhabdus marina TaxID=2818442 RepID=A0ABS3Q7Z9_9GAMM|nr:helix-turn-helix domain-containing protein [Thiomicrorhabdus marina]MBO1928427.1 hypothetical protein [Thiomicrorhabdus marina]